MRGRGQTMNGHAFAVMVAGMILVAGAGLEAKRKASGPKGGPFEAVGKPELQGGNANGPVVTEGNFVAKGFAFRDGERMAELRLHYRTLGTPVRDTAGHVTNAVMILHGTGGRGPPIFQPEILGGFFWAGGALGTAKYYIFFPGGVWGRRNAKPGERGAA